MSKGKARRSQLVTTYGVGALIPLKDESFMVAGIDRWPIGDPDLHEPRLERRLGVNGFRQPPSSEDGPDVPIVRFPRWASCPKCKRLAPHRLLAGAFDQNTCVRCNRELVPSRFVVVCGKGHIDDFPYTRWVHRGAEEKGVAHELFLEARGRTASLRDIEITCSCGLRRSMDGAFDSGAFRQVATCRGRRPWLKNADEDCGGMIRTLQRGASNVWFGVTQSAISIPPWSEGAFELLNHHWRILRAIPPAAVPDTISGLGIATDDYSVEHLVEAVADRKKLESGELEGPESEEDFRRQEFDALRKGHSEEGSGQFVARPEAVPDPLRPWIDGAMLVTRLREVRALRSFTRLFPLGGPVDEAPLFAEPRDWLPAIEVKGEGVFLWFSPERLSAWEVAESVRRRAGLIDRRYRELAERFDRPPARVITPRLLMAHTMAHALIDQLALDAGYPAASLRERLYIFGDSVGILIYTASTDSAGSLGGLVTQARSRNLEATFIEAIARAMWCSADPLCLESTPHGSDGLNLAACHACALIPETSCELQNSLLDRAMLIGTEDEPELGFFRELAERV